jgi:hypothetical protein
MMHVTADVVMKMLKLAVTDFAPHVTDNAELGDRIVPGDLRRWLARLRLLEGVPFAYLAPDSALLPPESIRFFYVDRAWTDALIQGALSVGTVNTSDRAQLEQLHRPIRDELDQEERAVRLPGGETPRAGVAGTMSGFLMRSRAISGWPGLHVRAYRREVGRDDDVIPDDSPDRIPLLRLERLAPAVLLALFDGVPQVVHIEEPRQGVQFGVRLTQAGGTNQFTAVVPARDTATGKPVADPLTGKPLDPPRNMAVSFRPGSPGVLNLRRTAQTFVGTPGTNMGTSLDGAEFALQMIRFPFRQVFGDPTASGPTPIADVFRPSVAHTLAALKVQFERVMP